MSDLIAGQAPLPPGARIMGWIHSGPDFSQRERGWFIYADPDPRRGIVTPVVVIPWDDTPNPLSPTPNPEPEP